MRLAYFPGCKIPFYMKDYGASFEALMLRLGIELVKLPFHCCGYPAGNDDFLTSMYCAIKNLAVAQQHDLDIITPCKCCFGQFKHAIHRYHQNLELKDDIDHLLDSENLSWAGKTKVKHLLSFLYHDVGVGELKKEITNPIEGKKLVVQYGCHALRPFSITRFDHPYTPKIFEELVQVTGIQTVEWPKSTECCGNPVADTNRALSLKILKSKFKSASEAGADYICSACTHCQIQYEIPGYDSTIDTFGVRPVLYTHVLGAALGIESSLSTQGSTGLFG